MVLLLRRVAQNSTAIYRQEHCQRGDLHKALTAAKNNGKTPYKTRSGRLGLNSPLEGYIDRAKEDYFTENGRIKYGVFDPRYKEAIEILRGRYAEGLIDPAVTRAITRPTEPSKHLALSPPRYTKTIEEMIKKDPLNLKG
ncbi:MAG: hypothetical protein LBF77_03960 [Spirochaetaceae bacterium]|jgi:hypothetical protein|nr:hypothetical protein [Spirochaetaceae bacterium]